ncbi:hypothetical protein GCM10010303_79730 [Streptomyces purpurascens]|nr:hypothetical protein GCM10010303_79730 [Streptomyces purpurascens]
MAMEAEPHGYLSKVTPAGSATRRSHHGRAVRTNWHAQSQAIGARLKGLDSVSLRQLEVAGKRAGVAVSRDARAGRGRQSAEKIVCRAAAEPSFCDARRPVTADADSPF